MMRTKFNIVLNKNKAKTNIQATYPRKKLHGTRKDIKK